MQQASLESSQKPQPVSKRPRRDWPAELVLHPNTRASRSTTAREAQDRSRSLSKGHTTPRASSRAASNTPNTSPFHSLERSRRVNFNLSRTRESSENATGESRIRVKYWSLAQKSLVQKTFELDMEAASHAVTRGEDEGLIMGEIEAFDPRQGGKPSPLSGKN